MNLRTIKIEDLFHNWGAGHCGLPANNAAMKSQVLSKLSEKTAINKGRAPVGMPWFSLALAGVAVVAFIILSSPSREVATQGVALNQQMSQSFFAPVMDKLSGSSKQDLKSTESIMPYLPTANTEIPSSDTREFLKTDYSASAKARHPGELTERLQTLVRGVGGRIDGATVSKKSGYISFVLPADKLDAFRREAVLLVGSRFIEEHLFTQNLLPQKVNLEGQVAEADKVLAQLRQSRDELSSRHEKTVNDLQGQIAANTKERRRLVAQGKQYPDQVPYLEPRIAELDRTRTTLNSKLTTENAEYVNRIEYADTQIQGAEADRTAILKQDSKLLDTVATVRGSISLSRMSVWEWVNEYVPFRWSIPAGLIAIALITFARSRRRFAIV